MKEILNINYHKFKLDNGLEVVLYPEKSLPLVSVNIWYKVGSANEEPGKTGFAHLFEHMMFQGSENVPKEMHFNYIQEAGGTLNGSTSIDRTNYYETLPSNYLELALWLESDRMGFLLPALTQEKLDNQKDVVMNERRQRYDNQPYGTAWEKLFNALYPENHPYSWPTIGWMDDIKKFELNDVKEFFKKYYSPNNASLVIGGDFEIEEATKLVEKYFTEIPGGNIIDQVKVPEFDLEKTVLLKHYEDVNLPKLFMAWHTTKLYNKDDAALDVVADIVSGSKNSRLTKKLVIEKQIAQNISAFQYSGKYDGSFIIVATPKPEVNIDDLKKEIFICLEELLNGSISEKELNRSKNAIKTSFIYSLQHLQTVANYLNNYNCYLNEPNSFLYDLNRYNNLTAEDVLKAAQNYLTKNYVELQILPKRKQ